MYLGCVYRLYIGCIRYLSCKFRAKFHAEQNYFFLQSWQVTVSIGTSAGSKQTISQYFHCSLTNKLS